MADDQNQRPFRSNNTPGRAGPSGNDPLAELARLIGQNDPFAEFGRGAARAEVLPVLPVSSPPAYARPKPTQPVPPAQPVRYGAPEYGRQTYGSPPLAGDGDMYHTGAAASGYPDAQVDAAYQHDPYDPNNPPLGPEDQDYYDDVPPRRRMGVLAIAAVFALAVIGTAGAFGYRALFGSSSSGPPPVIKADTAPSKIVPETKDAGSRKLINDRVAGSGQGEKLVSREEQPIEIKPVGVFPQQSAPAGSVQPPALGNGTVASAGEPKKIRTVVIRPDQPGAVAPAAADSAAEPPAAAPPRTVTNAPARPSPPPSSERAAGARPPAAEPVPEPAPRQTVARAAPPQRPTPSNAPLSLSPDAAPVQAAPPPARAAAAPARIAPPPAAAGSGYAVQLSSRRSEADAQAAFRSLQAQFPSQLGSRQPMIRRVDLGEKGVYYRAMVGPFGSSDEASRLCSSLKSAGGSCLIQKI